MKVQAALLFLLLLGACATPPLSPQASACLERLRAQGEGLLPHFAALGYEVRMHVLLDEELADSRGFRAPANVLGDATAGGRIRLRPSVLCPNPSLARAVIAHEMSHVALRHMGSVGTGVTLAWEGPPPQEREADELAYRVLERAGGDRLSLDYVRSWRNSAREEQRERRRGR